MLRLHDDGGFEALLTNIPNRARQGRFHAPAAMILDNLGVIIELHDATGEVGDTTRLHERWFPKGHE
jgi:hypothetical protein